MTKIDINNFIIKFSYKKYIYVFIKLENKILIKEIYNSNQVKEINFITIINDNIDIYSKKYLNNTLLSTNTIYGRKKEELLNRINESFNSNNIILDIINVKEFYESFKNILISDGNIALANKSIKNIYNNDYFILDIVLLETNSIIGSIKVKKDDININVDDDCLMDSLKLLNKFICIFLNDNKNYKIKQLINDII